MGCCGVAGLRRAEPAISMSLRIAFDCDGVIADLDSALAEIATRLFGQPAAAEADGAGREHPGTWTSAAPADPAAKAPTEGPTAEEEQVEPARFRALTRKQQHDIWGVVRNTENFWESLTETEPGAVARLATLARTLEWEVIFITQRPSSGGENTQLQTQRWLVAHGFDLPSVYVIKGSRGKVAAALSLDVVVDDRPENCLDVKLESRARAILIWNANFADIPPNAQRLGIEPVAGIGACLDLLAAHRPDRPGLFARLRHIIGG
jgi:hypothetical protein